jgi:hypothetical protein
LKHEPKHPPGDNATDAEAEGELDLRSRYVDAVICVADYREREVAEFAELLT